MWCAWRTATGGAEGRETGVDLQDRRYPQSWWLVDVAPPEPRLLGHEVVDLAPGAIELRRCARDLRQLAEQRERWIPLRPRSPSSELDEGHRRRLSFGPSVLYWVERDDSGGIHGGRPFRLLTVHASGTLTPATSAEIGLYFYGRRPAIFGFTSPSAVHGFIGLEWDPLTADDVRWLLRRESREAAGG